MHNHLRLWLVPLLLAATSTAAVAADSVTISNASAYYLADVKVLKDGAEIGAGAVPKNARKTIALKGSPIGGKLQIELLLSGKMLCKFTHELAADVTAWIVTGEPAVAGNYATAKCTIKPV